MDMSRSQSQEEVEQGILQLGEYELYAFVVLFVASIIAVVVFMLLLKYRKYMALPMAVYLLVNIIFVKYIIFVPVDITTAINGFIKLFSLLIIVYIILVFTPIYKTP